MLPVHVRRRLYDFLATLFAYPDPDSLTLLRREMTLPATFCPWVAPPPRLSMGHLHALQVAHTGLFDDLGAPLYGAIYLEGESRLIAHSTQFTAEAYRAEGLALEQPEEPPDYLPTELKFLAFLVAQEEQAHARDELAAAREAVKKQADFCRALLHSWVFDFCARVAAAHKAHPLYRFGGELLETFCRLEEDWFESSV